MRLGVLALALLAAPALADPAPRSGYEFMQPATQQLQDDDFLNPAFFTVERGESLWQEDWPGASGENRSCQSCHGDVSSLAGIAARYPRYDAQNDRIENVEMRIREEIAMHFQTEPPEFGADELTALTMLIGLQSRGQPMAVDVPSEAERFLALGQQIFDTRQGQLNLACKHCHSDHAGEKLRGDTISEGQINAFPIFRLIWDEIGTLDRMFTWCMEAVRAEPYAAGSQEYRALELYLAVRGAGLLIETPGVRR